MARFAGIWGRPYIDLERYIDVSCFRELHEEICFGLAEVSVEYTGGSHKWMGIVPESLEGEPYADYGQVIERFSRAEFEQFIALSDTPYKFDPDRQSEYTFGEEQDHPLNRRQMLYLKYRYGVYFPWKVYYEMIPNLYWDEKSSSDGKYFTREAQKKFPKTVAFAKSLPFERIGRCNLMGLEANDHGTVHRDGDPEVKKTVDHFITFCPGSGAGASKRLFLWDEAAREKCVVTPKAYWFNDSDYHGVDADPFFRYSIRVDGVFDPAFLARLERDVSG